NVNSQTVNFRSGLLGWRTSHAENNQLKVTYLYDRAYGIVLAENVTGWPTTWNSLWGTYGQLSTSNYSGDYYQRSLVLTDTNLDYPLTNPNCPTTNVNLKGANLVGSNFKYCNLAGLDLSGSNLQNANLQGANLQVTR